MFTSNGSSCHAEDECLNGTGNPESVTLYME